MTLLIISFFAGVLTVAAPCILPLLPVIIGGSLIGAKEREQKSQFLRPIVISGSLAVSVVIFTLLLKSTTALLGVPQFVWQIVSGGIIIVLGINFLWPEVWKKLSAKPFIGSNQLLAEAYKKDGLVGSVLIGSALGPVFSSCSPTYGLIVATILPISFAKGLIYLIFYAIGLSATLLLVAFFGQTAISKLKWLSNPSGWFIKTVGALFIVVGIFVTFGIDKKVQAFVLNRGWYDPISNFEQRIRLQ